MRSAWLKYTITVIILLNILLVAAVAKETKSAIDITRVGKGARPIALGGAYIALADDTFAIFTNPAGLATLDKLSFTSMSTQLMECVDYKLIGASYPTNFGNFAIGYVNTTTPAGDHTYMTSGVTVEGGAMYYSNSIIILSYGTKLVDIMQSDNASFNDISLGASIKLFSQNFTGDINGSPRASGTDLDLGAIYKYSEDISFGAVIQNATNGSMDWSTGEKERIASTIKVGVAYKPLTNVRTVLDIDLLDSSYPYVIHGGVEWDIVEYLTIRAGMDQNLESQDNGSIGVTSDLSAGVGINLGEFRLDYAYHNNNAILTNSTHYFSISYFGDIIPKAEAGSGNKWDFVGKIYGDEVQKEIPENEPLQQ